MSPPHSLTITELMRFWINPYTKSLIPTNKSKTEKHCCNLFTGNLVAILAPMGANKTLVTITPTKAGK
jgi:hypothetical protein